MPDALRNLKGYVVIVGAAPGDESAALAAAVRPFLQLPSLAGAREVLVAAATSRLARDADGPAQEMARLLSAANHGVRIVAPPRHLAGSLLRAFDRKQWSTLVLPANTSRLDRIEIPRVFTEADATILVNLLGTNSAVLDVWSRFARPLARAGAAISDARDGLAVEIARAYQPALIVLSGRTQGIALVVATRDQIVAELFGLAIAGLEVQDPNPETAIGPWEEPLVQRATELDLGVAGPGEIILRAEWIGAEDGRHVEFMALTARIQLALGIADAEDGEKRVTFA